MSDYQLHTTAMAAEKAGITIPGNAAFAAGGLALAGRSERLATIREAYFSGHVGCFCDSDQSPEWSRRIARVARDRLRANARCEFRASAAIPGYAHGSGKGKRAVNFQHAMRLDAAMLSGSQDFSNCVSWQTREMVGCSIATDIASGLLHEYIARPGTAGPYASRGYRSDSGMDIWTAAEFCHNQGIGLQIKYGAYDLSTEAADEKYGVQWGGGIPREFLDAIKNDRVEQVSEVDYDEEVVQDLLFGGHFIGTGSTTTAGGPGDPVSPGGYVGPHAQALIGYDNTEEFVDWYKQKTGKSLKESVYIFDQSWGDWLKMSNWPEHLWGPRPEGAFVLPWSFAKKLIGSGSVAINRVKGFAPKRLPDMGFSSWL